MTTFTSRSPKDTEQIAENLAQTLKGGETIAFKGGMGMGKTVFTRGLARGLGVLSGVSSPTFTIMKEYDGRLTVYHFDMYRITSLSDLYSCGFFDYVGDSGSVAVIEWSENISDALPENTVYINISRGKNESERKITIERAGL